MHITYDPKKREKTFQTRGLDFKQAEAVFADHHFTLQDVREDYGAAYHFDEENE